MIEIKNLAVVNQEIDAWLVAVTVETKQVARGLAGYALRWMATHSPQYSGDFAGNWKVGINFIDNSFEAYSLIGGKKWQPSFRQGSLPAVLRSLQNGLGRLGTFELGNTINLSNSAAHYYEIVRPKYEWGKSFQAVGVDHYAWKIEDNVISFRAENHEGGRVRERFLEHVAAVYGHLTQAQIKPLIAHGRL